MADGVKLEKPNWSKVVFAVVPILMAWISWTTVKLVQFEEFKSSGSRFTRKDGDLLYKSLDQRIDALPPEHVENKLQWLTQEYSNLQMLLSEFERNFSKEYVRKDELPNLIK